MGLKVWLPLNGSSIQRGTSSISMLGSPEVWDRNGQIGKCAKFSNHALYNSSKDFNYTKNFSFAMWIKVAGNGLKGASYAFTVGRADMGGWGYGINTSATSLGFWFGNQHHSFTITTNRWYHVAQTVDENKIRIYIDGVLKGTYDVGIRPTYSDGDGLGIGCFRMQTNSNFYFFNGYLNDFRIYDYCLSITEIKELSRGLVAHYNFSNISITGQNFAKVPLGEYVKYIEREGVYEITSPVNSTSWGMGFDFPKCFDVPWGAWYKTSMEVLCPTKETLKVDFNNSVKSGAVWSGNDNDNTSYRNTKLEIEAGKWTKIYWQTANLNSKNSSKVPIQPYDRLGLVTSGKSSPVKWKIRSVKTEVSPYKITDITGNGYDGLIYGKSIISEDSPRNSASIFLNGHRNPYLEFRSFLDNDSLKDCTITYWMNWTKATSLLFTGQSTYEYYLMAGNSGSTFFHTNSTAGSNIEVFKDGIKGNYVPTTDGWHFFAVRHVDLSRWTVAYINNHDGNWHNTGNISDLRIYSTPFSDEDIMRLYNSPIKISNKNTLMIDGEFIENGLVNMTAKAEQSRAQKKWENGISSYTQTKCLCSLTDEGYKIYRPANLIHSKNEHNMWGGFVLDNSNNHLGLIKGHSYVFMVDIKGKTSNGASEFYWSNNVGYDGGGLNPRPETISRTYPPENFNSSEFKTFHYAFKILDDIYKKCEIAYSSFVRGQTYVSYKGLKLGFGYWNTGSMGTDLYLRNIRLYDITGLSSKQASSLRKTGNIECSGLNELRNICEIDKYGNILSKEFIEH